MSSLLIMGNISRSTAALLFNRQKTCRFCTLRFWLDRLDASWRDKSETELDSPDVKLLLLPRTLQKMWLFSHLSATLTCLSQSEAVTCSLRKLVAQSARIASHLTHFHTYKSAATLGEGGVVLPHLERANMQMSDCLMARGRRAMSLHPAFKTSI